MKKNKYVWFKTAKRMWTPCLSANRQLQHTAKTFLINFYIFHNKTGKIYIFSFLIISKSNPKES